MRPAQILKTWNSTLYYQVLDWKDRNPKKFKQVVGNGSDSDSVDGVKESELDAIIIAVFAEVVSRTAQNNGRVPV